MIWLYRILYAFFFLFLCVGSLFIPKIREGLRKRWGLTKHTAAATASWNPKSKRFWFHFSSAGEFEQALPVLDGIKKERPDSHLVITFFSPSAERAISAEKQRRHRANLHCPWDLADYSPLDFPWTVSSFLQKVKPNFFVAVHRELWPEILRGCRQRNIPCYLIAAHLPRAIKKGAFFYRFCFSHFKQVFSVDERTRVFLKTLIPELPVTVLGDPRAERVLFRKKYFTGSSSWKNRFSGEPVLIGASLWDEDYRILRESLPRILEASPSCRLVLVPHEPSSERLRQWMQDLKSLEMPILLWSEWLNKTPAFCHLLVDQVGFLAELYSIGSCVLVGGSFKKRVHNILEPLVYECPIITGPCISNSSEAQELANRNILKVVKTSSELSCAVLERLQESDTRKTITQGSRAYLIEKENTGQNYVKALLTQ